MCDYDKDWYKEFDRKKGKRGKKGPKERRIIFSWVKLSKSQGQSRKDWENEGLLSQLCERMEQIEHYSAKEALASQLIKQYTKVGFPPNSEFSEPKGVSPEFWAVIHIKTKSKEVVAGYIEGDIFHIVFLDKEHKFWPSKSIQERGKNKR